jgi:hypothetical protein
MDDFFAELWRDTIGITTRAFVDMYETPHTEQMHMIERFQMTDNGMRMEVNLDVEDLGAFTTPVTAVSNPASPKTTRRSIRCPRPPGQIRCWKRAARKSQFLVRCEGRATGTASGETGFLIGWSF